jgi:hypothetical protein
MAGGSAITGLKSDPIKPEWSYGAIDHIRRYIMADDAAWQWGAGRSTIWLAERCKYVYAVESDPDRYNQIALELGLRGLTNARVYSVSELGQYARLILAWKRKFHLLFINEVAPVSMLECAKLAVKRSFRGSLIVLNDSDNIARHPEREFLEDWTRKGGRQQTYFGADAGHANETSVYSRG